MTYHGFQGVFVYISSSQDSPLPPEDCQVTQINGRSWDWDIVSGPDTLSWSPRNGYR